MELIFQRKEKQLNLKSKRRSKLLAGLSSANLYLEIKMKFEEIFKDYPLSAQNEEDYLHEKDPIVVVKLYDPSSSVTWYVTRYNPAEKIAYGFITGSIKDFFAHFSVTELEEVYNGLEMKFMKKRLSECLKDN